MRFVMKQKLLSLRDSFEILDDQQQLAFTAKSGFFSLRKAFSLKTSSEQQVAQIKQKLIAIKPTFYITTADGQKSRIKKCFFPLFTSRFIMSHPQGEIEIGGNFWVHEYQFIQNGNPIAQVSKQWFSWSDTYGIDIANQENIELILAAVVVIDAVMHDDCNSNFD